MKIIASELHGSRKSAAYQALQKIRAKGHTIDFDGGFAVMPCLVCGKKARMERKAGVHQVKDGVPFFLFILDGPAIKKKCLDLTETGKDAAIKAAGKR